jgi:hypothetical protein
MIKKQRLSASVDADVLEAAERAVPRGGTLSAWVNDALRLKLEHDRRLHALAAFVAAYEAEHGEITEEEMRAASRRARPSAVSTRSLRTRTASPARTRRSRR